MGYGFCNYGEPEISIKRLAKILEKIISKLKKRDITRVLL
jgi:hypothetical protein